MNNPNFGNPAPDKERFPLPQTEKSSPERLVVPEVETKVESENQQIKESLPQESSIISATPIPAASATTVQKSEALTRIENILEQDLSDIYFKMTPQLQQKFRAEGEVTAKKIEELLSGAKVQTAKIFKLIFKWLSIIPKVNKFFLKQEAKIKTDKIIALK